MVNSDLFASQIARFNTLTLHALTHRTACLHYHFHSIHFFLIIFVNFFFSIILGYIFILNGGFVMLSPLSHIYKCVTSWCMFLYFRSLNFGIIPIVRKIRVHTFLPPTNTKIFLFSKGYAIRNCVVVSKFTSIAFDEIYITNSLFASVRRLQTFY